MMRQTCVHSGVPTSTRRPTGEYANQSAGTSGAGRNSTLLPTTSIASDGMHAANSSILNRRVTGRRSIRTLPQSPNAIASDDFMKESTAANDRAPVRQMAWSCARWPKPPSFMDMLKNAVGDGARSASSGIASPLMVNAMPVRSSLLACVKLERAIVKEIPVPFQNSKKTIYCGSAVLFETSHVLLVGRLAE